MIRDDNEGFYDDPAPEAFNDYKKDTKKRGKDWKNKRHQKSRKHETKRDLYVQDEEQDNRRDVRTRW